MGKTFRRGGSERGYYSFGKSIRDKRAKGGTNRTNWGDDYNEKTKESKSKGRRTNSVEFEDDSW